MPLMGFEPTIPVFERAKTVHALDSAASVICSFNSVLYASVNNCVKGRTFKPSFPLLTQSRAYTSKTSTRKEEFNFCNYFKIYRIFGMFETKNFERKFSIFFFIGTPAPVGLGLPP
jgi:hypothetical protein